MDISTILSQFGAYYLDHGQNASNLMNEILRPTDTMDLQGVQRIRTKETIFRSADTRFSETLQAYQHGFTPNGQATFTPNVIQLQHIKSDIAMHDIDTIEASWLGFLAGDNGATLKTWPIVRYFIEQLWMPKFRENWELEAIYKGVRQESVVGNAGTASHAIDGIKKRLQEAAVATHPLTTVTTGALSTATIYEQMEAIAAAIYAKFSNRPFVVFCGPEFEFAYKKALRDLGKYVMFSDKDVSTKIDFTNVVIKGVESMRGTTDWFATIPQNMLYITKMADGAGAIDIQQFHRDIDIMIDYWFGVGFENNQLLFASNTTVAE